MPLTRESGSSMENAVIVDDCNDILELIATIKMYIYSLTAVPGESWTQYSESALVRNLCQSRIASYLGRFAFNGMKKNGSRTTYHSSSSWGDKVFITLLSSLFHLT